MTESQKPLRPRSVIGRLPRYSAGEPPVPVEGLTSYKLASNENPYPMLPSVADALVAETAVNRYPDPTTSQLRAAVAGAYGVDPLDIVAGQGSLGALNQILAAFAGQEPGADADEVIFAWRSFEAYPICVTLAGARPVPVGNRPDGSHDLDAMAEAVTDRTRVILLCTPNNPTGPALSHDDVESFLKRVPKDVVVVIDEAYVEFVRMDGAVDGLRLYREHDNVVLLRTFSKAHGLAGLRVGYSIQGPDLREYVRAAAVPFAVTRGAEAAAAASLTSMGDVLERVERIVRERERVLTGLRDLGWAVPDSQANFVWLDFSEEESDASDFAEAADRVALSVRAFPGEGVRVSIGEPEANTRFLDLCGNYPKTPRHS